MPSLNGKTALVTGASRGMGVRPHSRSLPPAPRFSWRRKGSPAAELYWQLQKDR